MNKKIFVTMLILSVCLLAGMYVAKIFFPQEFVFVIENQRIVAIGEYIDSHAWAYYLCCGITAYITYYLYCCACAGKRHLNIKENLIVIAFIIITRVVNFFDVNIATHISICSFFVIPWICKFNLKTAVIVYTVHGFAQILSLNIRDLPLYLTNTNFATTFLLGIESYFWLLLFYIIFNYKKAEA